MSKEAPKDIIYIDVEDEITAIIDKLRHSPSKIVALVLPKRAAALQSIVNLKLLKRTANDAKKNVVLVTSDPNLLPLAGAVGMYVAKTPKSKPVIPSAPKAPDQPITVDSDEIIDETEEPSIDQKTPIGQLAGALATEETIDVDNDTDEPKKATAGIGIGKGRKLRIPNFDQFRTRLFLGLGGLVLLIILWVLAAVVLPRATIEITTDTSVINANLKLSAKADAEKVDLEKKIIPLITKDIKKIETEKTNATGQRDDGKKATGTMTLTNCIDDGKTYTIPAGTAFSADDISFVTNSAVTLGAAVYSGDCISDDPVIAANFGTSKTVNVTAASAGDKYNVSARAYSPPGAYIKSSGSILASGSNMSGGTTKIVKVISQSDIDGAKQAALDKLNETVPDELNQQFTTDQAIAIKDTFKEDKTTVVASPKVNEEAEEVEVTVTVIYKQSGLKKEDLTLLIEDAVKKQIDPAKQTIQNTGLDEANIRITARPGGGELKLEIDSVVVAGPQLDAEGIKRDVAGKKKAETKDIIAARPGIQNVEVKYSPFWVFSTPKSTSHINVVFNQNNADSSE
jgi:hypothetical protein